MKKKDSLGLGVTDLARHIAATSAMSGLNSSLLSQIEKATKPFSASSMLGLASAMDGSQYQLRHLGLFDTAFGSKWVDAVEKASGIRSIMDPMGVQHLQSMLREADGRTAGLGRVLDSMNEIHRVISRISPPPILAEFTASMPKFVLPNLMTLDLAFGARLGVLTTLPNAVGGTLSWHDEGIVDEEPVVATAAWHSTFPARIEQPVTHQFEIVAGVDVLCAFCEKPILQIDQRISGISDYELKISIVIVPKCPRCSVDIDVQGRQSGLVITKLPVLKVLPGESEGDGRPHGRLRLVSAEEE